MGEAFFIKLTMNFQELYLRYCNAVAFLEVEKDGVRFGKRNWEFLDLVHKPLC